MSKALTSITAKEFNTVVREICKPGNKRPQYSNVTKKQRNLKMCGLRPSTKELAAMYAEIQAKFPHNKISFTMQDVVPYNGGYFTGLRVHIYFGKKPVAFSCPYAKLKAADEKAKRKAEKALQPKPVVLTTEEQQLLNKLHSARDLAQDRRAVKEKCENEMLFGSTVLEAMQAEIDAVVQPWAAIGITL